ncbi:C40 family peptidase [Desulfosporosinus sp. FKB]|uniref:C40 family peptidase n=1 Tax=Desulfosporosinus sp. FKB TaxID=1969835 RepID=UPI000B4A3410|nr:C40 family peptidase [Desulfosporosinus sp. FKB]
MKNKFKISIFLCLVCVFCLPLQVQAQAQTDALTSSQLTSSQTQSNSAKETPNNNAANELQQFAEQELKLNSQFSNQTEQELALDMKILSLQQSLQTINEGITNDQSALESQQKQLKDLQTQEIQLQKQHQDDSDKLGDILNTFYQSGNEEVGFLPYMKVLFHSTSMSDFLDRWEYVTYIMDDFRELNQEILIANTNITKQQSLINGKMASVKASLEDKEKLQQTQQQLLSSQQNLLAQVNSQEKATILSSLNVQSNIEELTQEQSLETSLAAAGREAGINPSDAADADLLNSNNSQLVAIPYNFESILAYAEQYLGTPYVWGGTVPSPGFDCSGFVQYVFGHFGVKLNRVSQDQFKEGIGIPETDLKPGDLLFFSTYEAGASHVGIYIGNNIMIDSEAYGVCFDNITNSYWASRYLGARRVVFLEKL